MKQYKNFTFNKLYYIFLLIFLLLYFIHAFLMLDPDFGWHLRLGQLILVHGFPRSDPFSYTMSGSPFVDYEWVSNIFIALLFPFIGKLGLDVFFSLILLTSLFLRSFFVLQKRLFICLIPVAIAGFSLLSFAASRVQVISIFFFSVFLTVLYTPKFYHKSRYLLPLLFLLWTNMHGGFAIGIFVYGIVIVLKTGEAKRMLWKDSIFFFLSLCATGITPYGLGIWNRVISTTFDGSVHAHIQEWLPTFEVHWVLSFWFFSILSFFMIWRYRKDFSLEEKFPFLLLFLLAVTSVRHVPLLIVYALPLTIRSLVLFHKEVSMNSYAKDALIKAVRIVFCIVMIMGILEGYFVFQLADALSEKKAYPLDAIRYLQKHVPKGNIYSIMGWNDYMIWKLPQKKIFISGMMPEAYWSDAPSNQSKSAFWDYINLEKGTISFISLKEKYHIDTVLLPVESNQKIPTFVDYLADNQSHSDTLEAKVKASGMMVVYKDAQAVIYQ